MPTTPEYANGVNNGFAALIAASVGLGPTVPTNVVLGFTAGAAGSKIDVIKIQITGQIPVTIVNVFIFDGTNYWLIDQFPLQAATQSATAAFTTFDTTYDRLTLSGGGTPEKLYFGTTVVPTSGDIIVTTIGGDF